MRAAILSDIHVTKENKQDALNSLEETLNEIDSKNPDLMIILGDLIGGAVTTGKEAEEEDEGIEEIKTIKQKIDEVEAEKIYLLGNHEQDIDKQKFSKLLDQQIYGVKQVGGENFIFLDSSAPELSGSRGQISRKQLDFLDEKLSELEKAFVIIHHPIHFRDLTETYYWDVYPERALCGNKKEINNVIQKHGNVEMVFNSHIHDRDLTNYKGMYHFTNPPFISEDREEGFNQYYTMVETGEKTALSIKEPNGENQSFKL